MSDTHFGYDTVDEREKASRVAGVFNRVAQRYDVMNDLMSLGMHRLCKRFAIAAAQLRRGERVLDVAGGSGDLARLCAQRVGPTGQVWLTDINQNMLAVGRDRLLDAGFALPAVLCDAERLPFPDGTFDCVTVGFGLRNMTHKERALREFCRVLRPGGRVVVLDFSHIAAPLSAAYDVFSFSVVPALGKLVVGDSAPYRYLAESIRVHPTQEALAAMLAEAGFVRVGYNNLAAGAIAVHRGFKC